MKDERISMLEDALRESVTIAAEREELLSQHVEISEDATRRIGEMESEYDRVTIEKAITNIKNAFLILSLSERDAVVASMRCAKKRHIEELLNVRYGLFIDTNFASTKFCSYTFCKHQSQKLIFGVINYS